MNKAEDDFGKKFVCRFFSQIYDEWITGINSAEIATVNASTCRALSAAIGSGVFQSVLGSLESDERIAVICSFEKTANDVVVIEILDYST